MISRLLLVWTAALETGEPRWSWLFSPVTNPGNTGRGSGVSSGQILRSSPPPPPWSDATCQPTGRARSSAPGSWATAPWRLLEARRAGGLETGYLQLSGRKRTPHGVRGSVEKLIIKSSVYLPQCFSGEDSLGEAPQ